MDPPRAPRISGTRLPRQYGTMAGRIEATLRGSLSMAPSSMGLDLEGSRPAAVVSPFAALTFDGRAFPEGKLRERRASNGRPSLVADQRVPSEP